MPGMKMVKNKTGRWFPDFAADGVGKMQAEGWPSKESCQEKATGCYCYCQEEEGQGRQEDGLWRLCQKTDGHEVRWETRI